ALGDFARAPDRFRQVAEDPLPLVRGPDMALGIAGELAPRLVEGGLEPDAGERVEERLEARGGMAHSSSGDDAQGPRVGRVDAAAVLALLPGIEVALDFRVEIVVAERARERAQLLGIARAQGDEPVAQIGELRERRAALALFPAGVPEGQQAAEVLVAAAVFAEQRDDARAFDFEIG